MAIASAHRMPRRWNVEIDGIKWLPRMCDKARMSREGRLGTYLMGHSPVDFALLKRLGVTTDEFIAVATTAPDDATALAAFRARGFDEQRVRRWSERFETTYSAFIPLWDLDEGYRKPNAFQRALMPLARAIEQPFTGLLRKIRPRP